LARDVAYWYLIGHFLDLDFLKGQKLGGASREEELPFRVVLFAVF